VIIVPPAPLVKVFVLLMDPATRDPDTFNDPTIDVFESIDDEVTLNPPDNVVPPTTLNIPVTVVLKRVEGPPTLSEPPVTTNPPVIVVTASVILPTILVVALVRVVVVAPTVSFLSLKPTLVVPSDDPLMHKCSSPIPNVPVL
jgi:hypothetical protein